MCFFPLHIALDMVSRLKGIETKLPAGGRVSGEVALDMVSRLKGIETDLYRGAL